MINCDAEIPCLPRDSAIFKNSIPMFEKKVRENIVIVKVLLSQGIRPVMMVSIPMFWRFLPKTFFICVFFFILCLFMLGCIFLFLFICTRGFMAQTIKSYKTRKNIGIIGIGNFCNNFSYEKCYSFFFIKKIK